MNYVTGHYINTDQSKSLGLFHVTNQLDSNDFTPVKGRIYIDIETHTYIGDNLDPSIKQISVTELLKGQKSSGVTSEAMRHGNFIHEEIYKFFTIKAPGEFGHVSKCTKAYQAYQAYLMTNIAEEEAEEYEIEPYLKGIFQTINKIAEHQHITRPDFLNEVPMAVYFKPLNVYLCGTYDLLYEGGMKGSILFDVKTGKKYNEHEKQMKLYQFIISIVYPEKETTAAVLVYENEVKCIQEETLQSEEVAQMIYNYLSKDIIVKEERPSLVMIYKQIDCLKKQVKSAQERIAKLQEQLDQEVNYYPTGNVDFGGVIFKRTVVTRKVCNIEKAKEEAPHLFESKKSLRDSWMIAE